MALVDGKLIAHALRSKIAKEVAKSDPAPSLAVFVTQPSFVVKKFIDIKAAVAKEVGIGFQVYEYHVRVLTESFVHDLLNAARTHQGLLIQLPLAGTISADAVKKILPITHDVDVYGEMAFQQFKEKRLPILPPVVGAISEILFVHKLTLAGKRVTVVGDGPLVGRPASVWAEHMGAFVTQVTRKNGDIAAATAQADVIILGTGSPGILTPDMVKDGAIILDAGMSEKEGKLLGDAEPACAEKASLFTPVPGGIGPIAVAKVFENLTVLTSLRGNER